MTDELSTEDRAELVVELVEHLAERGALTTEAFEAAILRNSTGPRDTPALTEATRRALLRRGYRVSDQPIPQPAGWPAVLAALTVVAAWLALWVLVLRSMV